METYSSSPSSLFTTMSGTDPSTGDPVFLVVQNIGKGFFAKKDLLENIGECIDSVQSKYGEELTQEERFELKSYMLKFLEEYA